MRKNTALLIGLTMVISVSLMSCGVKDKAEEAITPAGQNTEEPTEKTESKTEKSATDHGDSDPSQGGEDAPITQVSNDIKDQAKKEGVSVKELEKTLDGLAQLGGDKYGITKEEYIAKTEADGNTILSEWQLASENMGISITELYQFEKARGDNLTEEQKETMGNMDAALKLAQGELAKLEGTETMTAEELIGIDSNQNGEVVVVTMSDEDLREALTVDTYKVLQDYEDDYSLNYEYVSDAEYEDITAHYIGLVENTENYMKLEPMGNTGVMLQGMINEMAVYIEVDNSDPGKVRVSTYVDITSKK